MTSITIFHRAEDIRNILHAFSHPTSVFPLQSAHNLNQAMQEIVKAKQRGQLVGLKSGGYDGFHPNHYTSLVFARYVLAQQYVDNDAQWNELPAEEKFRISHEQVFFVVALDSDTFLHDNKSAEPKLARPLHPWEARAWAIAQASYPNPASPDKRKPLVNLICRYGDRPENDNDNIYNKGSVCRDFAPDVILHHKANHRYDGLPELANYTGKRIIIPEITNDAKPFFGHPYSTTNIIKRVSGKLAAK